MTHLARARAALCSGWILLLLTGLWLPVQAQDITSGLLYWWKLDDATGSSTAADSAGSNAGTLTNMDANTDWVAGRIGGGLDFDGTNDYVNLPSVSSTLFNGTNAWTISGWVYHRAVTASFDCWIAMEKNSILQIKATQGGNPVWALTWNDGSWHDLEHGSTHSLNQWTFVAATWNPGTTTATLYVNGSSVGTATTTSISSGARADVLGKNVENSNFFNGILDEVRVYNRALTSADITALYTYTGVVRKRLLHLE